MCATTRESSSPVDSRMEHTSQTFTTTTKSKRKKTDRYRLCGTRKGDSGLDGNKEEGVGNDEEECDAEVWETLSNSFKAVQSVLDQNRSLIQQVNENHQSKIHDNLVQNVALIREINGNISKVRSMYSDLSVNFSSVVQQRRAVATLKNGKIDSGSNNGALANMK